MDKQTIEANYKKLKEFTQDNPKLVGKIVMAFGVIVLIVGVVISLIKFKPNEHSVEEQQTDQQNQMRR